jgi:Fungal protein kinase
MMPLWVSPSFIVLIFHLTFIAPAHENLYNSDILHGDISENNVLIALRANDEEGSVRRGLLVDLDMARFVDLDKLDLDDTDPEDIIDSGATPNSEIDYIPEETPDSEPSVHSEGEGSSVLPDITVSVFQT